MTPLSNRPCKSLFTSVSQFVWWNLLVTFVHWDIIAYQYQVLDVSGFSDAISVACERTYLNKRWRFATCLPSHILLSLEHWRVYKFRWGRPLDLWSQRAGRSWSTRVTFVAPRTIPRRDHCFRQTSFRERFTTCISKHFLVPSTIKGSLLSVYFQLLIYWEIPPAHWDQRLD